MMPAPAPRHPWAGVRRQFWGGVLALPLVALVGLIAPGAAHAAPLPTPSGSTVQAAQNRAAATRQAVAQLTEQVAGMQAVIDRDQATAELAEQRYAHEQQLLVAAQTAQQHALVARRDAQVQVGAAQMQMRALVRQLYTSGDEQPSVEILFATSDPGLLLNSISMQQELAAHQVAVTAQLQSALGRLTSAETSAQAAVHDQATATAASDQALAQATAAGDQARTDGAVLAARLDAARHEQATAGVALALATAASAQTMSSAQAALQAGYESSAARSAHDPWAPNTGHWTPAIADSAVNRALFWLGIRYSFAGGSASGPTDGVAVDVDSRNDSHVIGFDCSGLSLYAWAPYISLDHFAATQYSQAGRFHPQIGELLPGDLVFWSVNAKPSGIGHVAIYVGDGNVIQAPRSGDVVKITPLSHVESGYFGATRPMT